MTESGMEIKEPESAVEVDILMATDLRFPGGNNASVVEEVRAQGRAGYRSALLHLPSPVQRSDRAYAPRIRQLVESNQAQLILRESVRTKLLVIRHPTVLMNLPDELPNVEAEHVLIIANQVPVDGRARAPYYDVFTCEEAALRLTGKLPQWAPIGPQVRKALLPYAGSIKMRSANWTNIIDVEAWYERRNAFVANPPIVGRHSRGDWSKWPATRQDIIGAYPTDGSYTVKILGGVEAPTRILGGLPSNWVDLPFNSVPPVQFLRGIDFLVYYHHPGLIEAFGRTILEGVASGAVAIVDPSFQETFGEACRYATIDRVRDELEALSNDFDLYKEQSERGVAHVRQHFSYSSHVRRVEEIIGRPAVIQRAPVDVLATVGPTPTIRILLDLAGEFDEWDHLDENVIAVVPETRGERLPEEVPVEYIPAHALAAEDGGVSYAIARVQGLSETFNNAPVLDTEARLPDFSLGAPVYHLTRRKGAEQPDGKEQIRGWTFTLRPSATRSRSSAIVARALASLRKRAPRSFVNIISAVKSAPRRFRRRLLDLIAPSGAILIRRGKFSRVPTRTPGFSLFVAVEEIAEVSEVTRRIAQRAAMANAFSPVLLAPTSWRGAAERQAIPLETIMERGTVERLGGSWDLYRQRRIAESIEVFQPISVGFLGDMKNKDAVNFALDSAESLGLRRSEKES